MNWADLYALVATCCGYTWPEIDAMSLSALRELLAYWSRHPPAHLLLAACLRRSEAASASRRQTALRFSPKPKSERAAFSDLAALAPGGVLSSAATRKS